MNSFHRVNRFAHRIKNWLPVFAWASLIFFFSTDQFSSSNTAPVVETLAFWVFPEISSDTVEIIHEAVRKLGHWSEYFVLAVLMLRALGDETGKKWQWRHAVHTLFFIFFYALSDEWHQTFVPSRTASFRDVMIDALGGICGILWIYWYGRGNLARLASRIRET
jgi:VanZ family protein